MTRARSDMLCSFVLLAIVTLPPPEAGATEPELDAGERSAQAEQRDAGAEGVADAGSEWTLPPQLPFVAVPDETDAGAAPVAEPPLTTAKFADVSARLSLIIDRMSLSDGTGAPFANAHVLVGRTMGRWSVGADVLANVETVNVVLRDQGSSLWARLSAGPRATDGVKLSLFPFSMHRLRIGQPPLSFGGDLVEPPMFFGAALVAASSSVQPRPATAARLDAQFGRFAGYGWLQTTMRTNAESNQNERQFMAAIGLRVVDVLGFEVGGDAVRAPRGWTPPTPINSSSSFPGVPITFEGYRLYLARGGIPAPVDFQWEARNPERQAVFFPAVEPTTGVHFGLHAEASALAQDLVTAFDASGRPTVGTVNALVYGGRASAQVGHFRAHLALLSRPPEYFLLENLSNYSYTFAFAGTSQDERSARLTFEWAFGEGLPRVGLGAGLIQPAARQYSGRSAPESPVPAIWIKYKEVGVTEGTDAQPAPITEARATVSWGASEMFALAAELKLENDPSRAMRSPGTILVTGTTRLVADTPLKAYASAILQIRL